jgi:archaellum component FlaC
MKNKIKIKKIKKFFNWFFSNTDNTEENLKQFGSLYALVERLQYRIEDLENEHMLMMKDMRKVMDALEERIDILNEECKESCTKN